MPPRGEIFLQLGRRQIFSFKRSKNYCRNYSLSVDTNIKVTVLGAAGGIGQPLSLLLKLSPLVSELHLVDITHTLGVSADLSHIDTPAVVKGFNGMDSLREALPGTNIVIIPAGVPRKPGMTRDDLFKINASIVRDLVHNCALYCPDSCIGIISNPVNSTVPIASEVLKFAERYDPLKIFGITTLDLVRANAFIAEARNLHPSEVEVPVIGGHAGKTIIPVLSQTKPPGLKFTDEEIIHLTQRIQEAGTEVVMAKAGAGSATLSMAYAGARFAFSLCKALRGDANVIEWAYVASTVTDAPYFSSKLLLGKQGIAQNLGIGELNKFEQQLVESAVKELGKSVAQGIDFVKQSQAEAKTN